MWTAISPRLVDADARANQLLQSYELQIQELEAMAPAIAWDGYCGLVKVSDEDLLRHDPTPHPHPQQHQQGQQQGQQPAVAVPPLAGGWSEAETETGECTPRRLASAEQAPGSATPPAIPPPGPQPSPTKATAQQLAEQAVGMLEAGLASEAVPLLHAALARCPLTHVDLAELVVGLLLEAERQLRGAGAGAAGAAAAAGPSEAARELRLALEALARDEPRRALQHLQRAQGACPPHAVEEQRRLELYRQLIQSKTHL